MIKKSNLLFFGLTYFIQGACLAYFLNYQKPYLAQSGVGSKSLGIFTGLLVLPFVLKFILGWMSDKIPLGAWGKRKPYLLMGLLICSGSFFFVAQVNPAQSLLAFCSLMFMASMGMALFDVSTDGLAMDLAAPNEEARIQSAMVIGKASGLIGFSLLLGYISQHFSFIWVFIVLSLLCLVPILFIYRIPEGAQSVPPKDFSLFKKLCNWNFAFFFAYSILYSSISFGAGGLMTYFLKQVHDVEQASIGHFGAMRGSGSVLAALIGSRLLLPKRYLRLGLLALLMLAVVISCAPYFLRPENLIVFALVWGVAWGFQELCYLSFAMHLAPKQMPATAFAFFVVFSNLGTSIGEGASTYFVDEIGFEKIFIVLALLTLPAMGLLKRASRSF